MTEDDIPREVARGVEKALFGREAWKCPVVAVRRPRSILRGMPSEKERQNQRDAEMKIYVDPSEFAD